MLGNFLFFAYRINGRVQFFQLQCNFLCWFQKIVHKYRSSTEKTALS